VHYHEKNRLKLLNSSHLEALNPYNLRENVDNKATKCFSLGEEA